MKKFFLVILGVSLIGGSLYFFRMSDSASPVEDEQLLVDEDVESVEEVAFENFGWVRLNGYQFVVEIAENERQRTRGLMYRSAMGGDEGMLFVFDDERVRSFWMKNTLIPLSIAYIDSRGVIVSIADMNPLDETPVPSFAPARFALEVNQGRFQELNIKPGMKMEWGRY